MSPAARARKILLWAGLLLALPASLWSQTNLLQGGEISLTPGMRGDQTYPAIALASSGGFLVWQDNITDPSGLGISMRRFSAGLHPEEAVVRVNQSMGNDQQRPRVSMLNNGGAVVVWQSGKSGAQDVFARFVTPDGGFAGDEIRVNEGAFSAKQFQTVTWTLMRNNRARNQRFHIRELVNVRHNFTASPSVATLNDGSVAVVYSSSRVFSTNTFTVSETIYWNDKRSMFFTNRTKVPLNVRTEAMQDVYIQRFTAAGQKLGAEFRAHQFSDFNQRDAGVAALPNGNFVVVWVSELQRTNSITDNAVNPMDIYGRVFDVLGNPVGNEFRINTTQRHCGSPAIASTDNGFVVTWTQRGTRRADGTDIAARFFAVDGTPQSGAVPVNQTTFGDQFTSSVATVNGQQLIVWCSMGQDGSWEGVYGRAFKEGEALSDEFRVNVVKPFSQFHPKVTSDGVGRAMIIWSGYAIESGFDLFGRQYIP